jgi:thioredoxin 1
MVHGLSSISIIMQYFTEYTNLISITDLNNIVSTNPAVLIYFSSSACNVCKVLRPKLAEAVSYEYPLIKLFYVDIELHPEISGQLTVFNIPTVLVFFNGKEYLRKSRSFGIAEVLDGVKKPYSAYLRKGS